MSNWNKNVNVHWYGNLNKLIWLGVLLSIPVIGFGIYLWSRYLAARIVVWVVAGLVGIGLFTILIRWVIKVTGIKIPKAHDKNNKWERKPAWKTRLEARQQRANRHKRYNKHKHH